MKERIRKFYEDNEMSIIAIVTGIAVTSVYVYGAKKLLNGLRLDSADLLTNESGKSMIAVWNKNGQIFIFKKNPE